MRGRHRRAWTHQAARPPDRVARTAEAAKAYRRGGLDAHHHQIACVSITEFAVSRSIQGRCGEELAQLLDAPRRGRSAGRGDAALVADRRRVDDPEPPAALERERAPVRVEAPPHPQRRERQKRVRDRAARRPSAARSRPCACVRATRPPRARRKTGQAAWLVCAQRGLGELQPEALRRRTGTGRGSRAAARRRRRSRSSSGVAGRRAVEQRVEVLELAPGRARPLEHASRAASAGGRLVERAERDAHRAPPSAAAPRPRARSSAAWSAA